MKTIWQKPLTVEEINERCKNSLSDLLGIEFIAITDHSLTARMPIDSRTIQPMGIVHGGATAALAETVASAAGNYCINQQLHYCVGLELNINHIRPIRTGFIYAEAKPYHLGTQTQVWEIQIRDEDQKLVSAARLTLMKLNRS